MPCLEQILPPTLALMVPMSNSGCRPSTAGMTWVPQTLRSLGNHWDPSPEESQFLSPLWTCQLGCLRISRGSIGFPPEHVLGDQQ